MEIFQGLNPNPLFDMNREVADSAIELRVRDNSPPLRTSTVQPYHY